MTTEEHGPGKRERIILYGVIAVLIVVLMVIAVAMWSTEKTSREAEEKADRLGAALVELGVPEPDQDRIVAVLGNDGGAVCADPASALQRAASLGQLSNGAGGPGTRPIIADRKVVEGQLAIITIYCPEHLSEFEEFVDELRTADLIPE